MTGTSRSSNCASSRARQAPTVGLPSAAASKENCATQRRNQDASRRNGMSSRSAQRCARSPVRP